MLKNILDDEKPRAAIDEALVVCAHVARTAAVNNLDAHFFAQCHVIVLLTRINLQLEAAEARMQRLENISRSSASGGSSHTEDAAPLGPRGAAEND